MSATDVLDQLRALAHARGLKFVNLYGSPGCYVVAHFQGTLDDVGAHLVVPENDAEAAAFAIGGWLAVLAMRDPLPPSPWPLDPRLLHHAQHVERRQEYKPVPEVRQTPILPWARKERAP